MNNSPRAATAAPLRTTPLFALASAFTLLFFQFPTAQASAPVDLQRLADKAPTLPLTSKFEKVTEGEGGPYVLKLKNTSNSPLTLNGRILLSVSFHAESKARKLPEHVVEAGQVWTIPELAANDKVMINAKDFAPLELTVP